MEDNGVIPVVIDAATVAERRAEMIGGFPSHTCGLPRRHCSITLHYRCTVIIEIRSRFSVACDVASNALCGSPARSLCSGQRPAQGQRRLLR